MISQVFTWRNCSQTLFCAPLVYSNLSCLCCPHVRPPPSLVYWYCLVIAGPLAPPPPSMQITPQLPLMGFVARVQETSKWFLAPRSHFLHERQSFLSPLLNSIHRFLVEYKQVINFQHQLGQGCAVTWENNMNTLRFKSHEKTRTNNVLVVCPYFLTSLPISGFQKLNSRCWIYRQIYKNTHH